MKKLFSFALVALMTGLLLCSCTKSKEAQFIDDLQNLVKTVENLTTDQLSKAMQGEEDPFTAEVKKMQEKYGDLGDMSKEDLQKAGFNFTDEQVAQIAELQKKAEETIKKKVQEMLGGLGEAAGAAAGEAAEDAAEAIEDAAEDAAEAIEDAADAVAD